MSHMQTRSGFFQIAADRYVTHMIENMFSPHKRIGNIINESPAYRCVSNMSHVTHDMSHVTYEGVMTHLKKSRDK